LKEERRIYRVFGFEEKIFGLEVAVGDIDAMEMHHDAGNLNKNINHSKRNKINDKLSRKWG